MEKRSGPAQSWDNVVSQVTTRLFFRSLFMYLAIDLVVKLAFSGPGWAMALLLAAEGVALVQGIQFNDQLLRRSLQPLRALEAAADMLRAEELDPEALRSLSRRLDQINARHLHDRIAVPGGREELSALANAINSMLGRIEADYQAQARFVSDASHELRTPIAVIQGYANMLDRWGKDDPAVRQEAIDSIRQEADSMGALVEQLLFLARGDNETQVVHLGPMDLSELCEDVCRETRMLDTGREIRSDIVPAVFLTGDAGLLKQAMRILVDNAVKYTPPVGGLVTIRLETEGEMAKFSVTDNGPGIPREELPKIFGRFYRADQSRTRKTGGTGLGLPIAAWIARRHGGHIQVVSRVGLGSRFTFLLPMGLTPDPAEEAASTEPEAKMAEEEKKPT